MHMVIRAIVYALNEKEALDEARVVFDSLCGDRDPFDSYTMFDDDFSTVSGKARWGALPAAVLADSDDGKKLIREGMEAAEQELRDTLDRVRHGLKYLSNDDIWNNADKRETAPPFVRKIVPLADLLPPEGPPETYNDNLPLEAGILRYLMSHAGEYAGSSIWLYDNHGDGITNPEHLERVLNKWDDLYEEEHSPYKGLNVYVVPADVHH